MFLVSCSPTFGLFTSFCRSLPLLCSRLLGNPPSSCLTSWNGWALSPSQWFGCLSSTVWLLLSQPSTRPNAISANNVPSGDSGRCGFLSVCLGWGWHPEGKELLVKQILDIRYLLVVIKTSILSISAMLF